MNKSFVYAYLQFNLGDDLFVKHLITKYPKTKFYIVADSKYKRVFKKYKNLIIIPDTVYKFKILNKIKDRLIYYIKKECETVIFIGGSIFMEYPEWKNIINWYKEMSKNKHCYIIGANFGPYYSDDYLLECKDYFRTVDDVCFRDKWSYNLFKDCNTVRYAPDILFGLNVFNYKINSIEKKVVISVIDCQSRDSNPNKLSEYHEQYVDCIKNIIEILNENKFKITLLSFCEQEKDGKAIGEIISGLDQQIAKNISCFLYDGLNMDTILREIGTASYIVGTRFHSIILGAILNKPILPIVYSNKTKNLLMDVKFLGNIININEIGSMLINNNFVMKNYLENINIQSEQFVKKSDEHFLEINKSLNIF